MQELTIYLIRSAISMILFYGIYAAFLRRDTFFAMNRFYLLSAMTLSLIIPFFPGSQWLHDGSPAFTVVLETITITPSQVAATFQDHLSLFQALFIIYITGVILFSARFLVQLFQISSLIRKYGITRKYGLRLVILDKAFAPFSFFQLVFLNPDLVSEEHLDKILEHEKIHVAQKHTLDLLLLEFVTIVQWFNPVIWFYRSSLKGLHEYLADEGVLKKGTDRSYYQDLLLQHTAGIQVNDLTNNFNHSLLKRRFMMMTRNRSHMLGKLKYAFAFPASLFLALFLTFAVGEYATAQEEKSLPPPPPKKGEASQAIKNNDGQEELVYIVVEVMPEFEGGHEGLIRYITDNVKYPEEARKEGVEGKVFVSFLITDQGKVRRPTLVRGIHPSLDAEALRVVREMPDWTPGEQKGKKVNVEFTLPIHFSLGEDQEKKE